jgi:hypothetical protein
MRAEAIFLINSNENRFWMYAELISATNLIDGSEPWVAYGTARRQYPWEMPHTSACTEGGKQRGRSLIIKLLRRYVEQILACDIHYGIFCASQLLSGGEGALPYQGPSNHGNSSRATLRIRGNNITTTRKQHYISETADRQ